MGVDPTVDMNWVPDAKVIRDWWLQDTMLSNLLLLQTYVWTVVWSSSLHHHLWWELSVGLGRWVDISISAPWLRSLYTLHMSPPSRAGSGTFYMNKSQVAATSQHHNNRCRAILWLVNIPLYGANTTTILPTICLKCRKIPANSFSTC